MWPRDPAKHAVPTLIVLTLVTAGAAWGTTLIEPRVDFVDTVPEHPGLEPYRLLLQELDGVRFLAIYQAHDEASGTNSLRDEAFDALVQEQAAFSAAMRNEFPVEFGHELSVQEAMKQGHYMFQKIATGGNPPDSAYSIPQDQATYDQVKQQLLADDTLNDILSINGTSALSLFFIETESDSEARQLVIETALWLSEWKKNPSNHPVTSNHQPTGLVWASAYTDSINQQDLQFWLPLTSAAVAITLLWIVRGPTNVLVAVASLAAALTWTFGLLGLAGIRVSFLTVFLAPLVVGIGIDYAVHILHRFQEERGRGQARGLALQIAVRKTGAAVMVAATTTIAALLWMGTVPAVLFSQIGIVAAIGIGFGFIASVLLAPALLAVLPDTPRQTKPDMIGPAIEKIAKIPRWFAWSAIFLIVSGSAWIAVGKTTIESGSQENEFPQNDPVILLQHQIEAEYGSFQRAYLVVEGEMAKADALREMLFAVENASSIPLYRDASAVTDILLADEATDEGGQDVAQSILNNQTGNEPTDEERLPQTDQEARAALIALFDDPLWRVITPFTINDELDLAVVAIEIEPWNSQEELVELRQALLAQANSLAEQLGPSYKVSAAGAPVNRAAIIEQTVPDVVRIVVGSAVVVFVMLGITGVSRPRGLLVAAGGALMVITLGLMLVAAIPILDWVYDATGGINSAALNAMFLLAFAVAVGIGIDDLVHVAHRTWEHGSFGDGLRDAGRPITGTTMTTFVAFAVMAGVYFLQSKNLAILTAFGVISAYFLTLLMAPAVLGGLNLRKKADVGN